MGESSLLIDAELAGVSKPDISLNRGQASVVTQARHATALQQ
jgi:hypothetical protein